MTEHEPSCCELACYEDPGCACDGCRGPATDLDGKPFCPFGYAQRYHIIGQCACPTRTDPRIAALAEAIRWAARRYATGPGVDWPESAAPQESWAAAILAELPPDWCGHDPSHRERCHNYDPDAVIAHLHVEYDKATAKLARLRRIEEKARLISQWADNVAEWGVPPPLNAELRELRRYWAAMSDDPREEAKG